MGFHVTLEGPYAVISEGGKVLRRSNVEEYRNRVWESRTYGDYLESVDALSDSQAHLKRSLIKAIIQQQLQKDSRLAALDAEQATHEEIVKLCEAEELEDSHCVICHLYWNTTVEEVDNEFNQINAQWQTSHKCELLVGQLRMLATRSQVTNVVALGIGSLHGGRERGVPKRPALQLAAVLTILNTLGDPSYSALDKRHLHSLGLEAVDDPDAFSRIDGGSLVIHIGTYFKMAWWITRGIWPAAMVANDWGWGNPRPSTVSNYPESLVQQVHSMYQNYDHETFVDGSDDSADSKDDVNLYWRKS
ncbi:MAG: hypothetical protein M4579_006011 [Chaenotheca gracillima]|nr:MAG: hypothetical protein M4579_006011 [Chaenotheca gracillima]